MQKDEEEDYSRGKKEVEIQGTNEESNPKMGQKRKRVYIWSFRSSMFLLLAVPKESLR